MTKKDKELLLKDLEVRVNHLINVNPRDVQQPTTNHFNYHNLIPMGLAIEAPEDMYKL